MSRNSTGYTGQLEPRRREFLSLVATLLSQETHDILLQTLNLFQLAIAICENINFKKIFKIGAKGVLWDTCFGRLDSEEVLILEKISFFSADFRDGRIRIGNKTYPAGTFATHLLNQYYKDETAARLAVFKQYSWHLYDTISAGYLDNNDFLKAGWEIQQILLTLPKLQPFTKLDVEAERIRISELFTEDNANFIREYFNAKAQILAMEINESALDLLPIRIDKEQQNKADKLIDNMMTTLTFYDRISNDMREAFEGLTEYCDRLNEAERFDEPHLLPIVLDIFGNEKIDVTFEYVAMRKTAKSKTMVTARRMYFDNYYSFVLTDFFEGLHYGHYDFGKEASILQRKRPIHAERQAHYLPKICGEDEGKGTFRGQSYQSHLQKSMFRNSCRTKKKHHHSGVCCNGAEGC